ncbi:MAG TPA: putative nucleotidyltransferase substrate binding domain-containing protein [Actinomycetota bacterium]|nr:putative nucleotidyltransferase substrate binding domain-containing protein [Actinomycetota bacterium]
MEPVEFVMEHPPFDHLDDGAAHLVATSLETLFFPQGARVLERGGDPSGHLYMIRKGTAELTIAGDVVQALEEGDTFGFPSLIGGAPPAFDVVATDDILVHRIPEGVFDKLMEEPSFAAFWLKGLGERLRLALPAEPMARGGDLATPVGRLLGRSPVTIDPAATVAEAAQVMRSERVSSVIVSADPPGIITDRDLRARVVADSRASDTPAAEVMSRPLKTVAESTPVYGALLLMLEEGVHHLPVTRGERIEGLVTDTDLLRHQARSPLYLRKSLEKAQSPDALAGYSNEIAEMAGSLFYAGLDTTSIGRVIASLNDALTVRLLRLAEEGLGAPPTPYAWIVYGSQGRSEQLVITDQDNALVYLEGSSGAAAYFDTLMARVTVGLQAAGFPEYQGKAITETRNVSLDELRKTIRSWVHVPDPEAILSASMFLDHRKVFGGLDLAPVESLMRAAEDEGLFMRNLAQDALRFTPPISLWRTIRNQEAVDLKRGGIAPIVHLARLYALRARRWELSTIDRLAAAAEEGTLSSDASGELTESFRFLLGLRLAHQLRALSSGQMPADAVDSRLLSPRERRHLKDAFLVVRRLQKATADAWGVALGGP